MKICAKLQAHMYCDMRDYFLLGSSANSMQESIENVISHWNKKILLNFLENKTIAKIY